MPLELIDENDELLFAIAWDELQRQKKEILKDPNQVNSINFWDNELLLIATAFFGGLNNVLQNGVRRSFEITEGIESALASVDTERLLSDTANIANQTSFSLVTNINETTRSGLNDVFARSIEENLSTNQLAKLIAEMPEFGEARARLIAITESTRAFNQGNEIAANELRNNGFVIAEIWNTVMDGQVCVICEPLEGTKRGEGWTEYPPDGSHIGCRCFITNEVVEI